MGKIAQLTYYFVIGLLLGGGCSAAFASDNNEKMKACLALYDYSIDKFDTFDFSAASACAQGHRTIAMLAEREEIRKFLEEKPHYRGTNWKWEENAEYTCKHINTLQGSAVVCQKPYYLN